MEVVAGIASVGGVVGILSIVGQAINGILKLKDFVHEVSTASETVKSFFGAINSLENTLTAISDLLKRAPEEWLVGAETQTTDRLRSQIGECRADIGEWVKEMHIHHAESSKATKSFFRKLRVASNEKVYSKFHQMIERHLQGLQMSLSLLGCSYDTYILKQGGFIAENVKNLTEAQTSFNHESTQRFLKFDQSFSTHLDPVSSQLDRLESSFDTRLDPVSSQLDRLESSSEMSRASMSSLASNVSRILEFVSSNAALAVSTKSENEDKKLEPVVSHANSTRSAFGKTKLGPLELLQQPSPTQMEWSCDFLPGIEAAFSASGFSCLYCGDEFDQDSADWSLRGRHLVDEHRYGECNLLLAYDSEENFARHIQDFHQCSLGYIYHISNELLNRHCHFGRKMGFHRGLESKDQNLTDDFHSIRSRRWKALFDNSRRLIATHGHSRTESAQDIQPVQRPSELDLYTALSEEDRIVDGLMIAPIFRPWSLFNIHGDDITKPCYSLGDGIKVSRYEFDYRCDTVLEATRLLRTHDTNRNQGLADADLLRTSSATSVLPKGHLDRAEIKKERSRINSWLQEILKSSSTTKIIMFYMMKEHGVHFSDMHIWLEKVLEFWDLDEAATRVDEPDNLSDGAVDSRGSPEIPDVNRA